MDMNPCNYDVILNGQECNGICCCSISNRLVNDSYDMDSRVYSYSIGVENSYLVEAGISG